MFCCCSCCCCLLFFSLGAETGSSGIPIWATGLLSVVAVMIALAIVVKFALPHCKKCNWGKGAQPDGRPKKEEVGSQKEEEKNSQPLLKCEQQDQEINAGECFV